MARTTARGKGVDEAGQESEKLATANGGRKKAAYGKTHSSLERQPFEVLTQL